VTEHLPLTTFLRCVALYAGEHKIKHFTCREQFLCLAFAQLTYRESLRDIEACLRAQRDKLYHMGIRSRISRSTLADANEVRDWRIYADFAQRLIVMARKLYIGEPFGVDLKETVYALDTTTIDLCLSVFPWAPFRRAKAAVKLHKLLDLRGKSNLKAQRRYSHPVDRTTGLVCDQTIVLTGFYSLQGSEDRQAADLPQQQLHASSPDDHRAVSMPLAGGALFQMDKAASSYQAVLWHPAAAFRCRRSAGGNP
jgi:hypothetical protein